MTFHQYGTLKYILSHDVQVTNAGSLSMVTFGSLVKRGWIQRVGTKLELTDAGYAAYGDYHNAKANFRKYDTGLTEHVRTMLHVSKLSIMKEVS